MKAARPSRRRILRRLHLWLGLALGRLFALVGVTGEAGAIPARYCGPHAKGHHPKREMVWFSADGSTVLRAEPWGGYLMSWLYQLR